MTPAKYNRAMEAENAKEYINVENAMILRFHKIRSEEIELWDQQ